MAAIGEQQFHFSAATVMHTPRSPARQSCECAVAVHFLRPNRTPLPTILLPMVCPLRVSLHPAVPGAQAGRHDTGGLAMSPAANIVAGARRCMVEFWRFSLVMGMNVT